MYKIPNMRAALESFKWNLRRQGKNSEGKEDCSHSKCEDCQGSGRKQNGEICVHIISCRCLKCSPTQLHTLTNNIKKIL